MDFNQAILYAQLVNQAYVPAPGDLTNQAGKVVAAGLGAAQAQFDVITTIYADDLATQSNPARGAKQVSIGLVLQAQGTGEAVIAFRGTEGIKEWVLDATFGTVKPCPFLTSAGETEDGFTDMYMSVATGIAAGSPRLIADLPNLAWKQPVETVTVCGHSLGGALATLATLDITVNAPSPYHNVISWTYASPRVGDAQFALKYNQLVLNTFRIANQLDVVPRLPLLPYDHVMGEFDLKPYTILPPKFLVQPNPYCEHILTTYLYLLSSGAGGQILPLKAMCGPLLSFSALMSEVESRWNNLDGLKTEFSRTVGLV
jgi:Lipase (class 3)